MMIYCVIVMFSVFVIHQSLSKTKETSTPDAHLTFFLILFD